VENAGTLSAYFVDVCRAFNGTEPPRKVTLRVGTEANKLLREKKIRTEDIRKGIQILVDRGLDPSRLPECVFTAQSIPDLPVGPDRVAREEDRDRRTADRAAIDAFVARNGGRWPTGARIVRGTHSSGYVYDPLGYETVPRWFNLEGSGIHRPTRDEVLEALSSTEPPDDHVTSADR
jgi:hypothetical protein